MGRSQGLNDTVVGKALGTVPCCGGASHRQLTLLPGRAASVEGGIGKVRIQKRGPR